MAAAINTNHLRITSLNINSIRARLHVLEALKKHANPDILCLQETKVDDPLFPHKAMEELGYKHVYIHGQKAYHGVAILSKVPLTNIHSQVMLEGGQARHIQGTLPDGTVLHNLYIPAGGDIPDREQNPYYGFKLDYIEALEHFFTSKNTGKKIVVGDFNVAPLEHDVWSHKQLLNVVSHTPAEVERLEKMQKTGGWVDIARREIAAEEKHYTWWSYRNQDWRKSNRGRRLDHIWVTPDAAKLASSYATWDAARDLEKCSDHIPLWVDYKL